MVEVEKEKAPEAEGRAQIQVQTGDIEVAKLQLAARWAEQAVPTQALEELLKAFNNAYKAIDETMRM